MPFRFLSENAAVAATNIVNDFQHLSPASPYAHVGDQQIEALQQLDENFQCATIQRQPDQPEPPVPIPPSSPQFKAVRFRKHPRVAVPRVTAVPTMEHVPKVPTAPKEATMPPSYI